jgi:hypothetical protein
MVIHPGILTLHHPLHVAAHKCTQAGTSTFTCILTLTLPFAPLPFALLPLPQALSSSQQAAADLSSELQSTTCQLEAEKQELLEVVEGQQADIVGLRAEGAGAAAALDAARAEMAAVTEQLTQQLSAAKHECLQVGG